MMLERFKTYFIIILVTLFIFNIFPKESSPVIYKDADAKIEKRVNDLLMRMSLDEKIGQMTQIERADNEGNEIPIGDISKYMIGSILSGGGSTPKKNKVTEWAKMYDRYQNEALKTSLSIPLIYGVDSVHGHGNLKGATVFPHNIGMGATRNPELAREVGRITALETAATGIDWTFSPCIAVSRDDRWGRTYESFGEDPDLVSLIGKAVMQGYQGADLKDNRTILATAKHWLGDGGTKKGIDQGNNTDSDEEMRRIHMKAYVDLINEGVGAVMISLSMYNGERMHGNKYWITDVLKKELGFEGIVLSDWEGINALPYEYERDIKQSINAGIDMVMVPYEYIEFLMTLKMLVEEEEIPMSRIDDAVKRILRIKFALGLFEKPLSDSSLVENVGTDEHRNVARQAVRESVVLLKNNELLPVKSGIKRIHVVGKNADDLGYQCGGWTIEWQGGSGNITDGTTILKALKNGAPKGTRVTYSETGKGVKGADICIAVIGETPYAEFKGYSKDLTLHEHDLLTLERVKDAGVPVVVILVSGRPLLVEDELKDWDAFIAAWLPGTEADGISDVVYGKYNPTGRLPFTWPRDINQEPINIVDNDYNPLFEYGFGLSYE